MYRLVAANNVENIWHEIAPWIIQAMRIDEEEVKSCAMDLEAIKLKAKQGVMQIWLGEKPDKKDIDMVLVTESLLLANEMTLVVRWASGLGVIEDMLPDFGLLENWAKTNGYHEIQIWGRKGWEKLFRPLGYKHDFTVISRVIDRGIH